MLKFLALHRAWEVWAERVLNKKVVPKEFRMEKVGATRGLNPGPLARMLQGGALSENHTTRPAAHEIEMSPRLAGRPYVRTSN